ncbi:MAG TPA: anti-sigma factor [Candidatus Angelobacter sp.]|nr:anti-sigma factor [Candidatus Angelobacter sp.]
MNGHPQFAEALALYALGALDSQQERTELESHLGTCGECRRELEALRADTALLALSAVGPKPPDRVRERLLKAVAAEPRMQPRAQKPYVVGRMRPRWLTFAPMAVMLLLAVFSILLWRDLRDAKREVRERQRQIDQLTEDLNKTKSDLAAARDVRDVLHAPDAWPLTLVQVKASPQPQMKVIYSKQKGAIFVLASNTHQLPEDKIYQLWLLPSDGGAPMPCGWFKPDSQGNGMIMHHMHSPGISAKSFAVTIENAGGSETPTMPIVMEPAG